MVTQVCSKCGKSKKTTEYAKNKNTKTGLDYWCSKCRLDYINTEEELKDYCRENERGFNEELLKTSLTNMQNKYSKQGITDDQLIMEKTIKQYFSKMNLTGYDGDIITDKKETRTNKRNDETKIYSNKWNGYYTNDEIKYLDDYLQGLHDDYKIATVNHRDYAKKIAQASLYVDRCFQDVLNGVAGADKKWKDAKDVFDSLSKSAEFSQSTRGQNDVGLGCFGRVFEMVENLTYIPEHIPTEKDDIDNLIDNIKHILKSV